MWKIVLLGYDGSEHSEQALVKAEEIALQNNSKLIIANVYRELVTRSFSINLLEEVKSKVSEKVQVETVSARNTDVDNELIEIAEKNEAELIIVGSRGLGEGRAIILGSVSHEIATSAPTDVLIVRDKKHKELDQR